MPLSKSSSECGVHLLEQPCEKIKLCPNSPEVTVEVIAANLGGCKSSTNGKIGSNLDSIMFKVIYGKHSVMFNGDFEVNGCSW